MHPFTYFHKRNVSTLFQITLSIMRFCIAKFNLIFTGFKLLI